MAVKSVLRPVAAVMVAVLAVVPAAVLAKPESAQQRVRVGGDIKEPKKIRHVSPVYPEDARAAGVQGIIILEVVIGKDGSVHEAKVLRSVPQLDRAALDAVMQWRYTPTFLNDEPVEIVMTVTVTFTLTR